MPTFTKKDLNQMKATIGTRIRNARLGLSSKLGYSISQREFGQMCGWGTMSQSRTSNYETGRREPSLEDLLKIIAVSGASPTEFFEDDEVLAGINMDHVEAAFNKVQEESFLPKTLQKTLHYPEIDNSIKPVLFDRSPTLSEDLPIALFKADRDTDTAREGETLWVDTSRKSINKRGVWMIQINNEAVHTKCVVNPNGTVTSEDFGELDTDTTVLGKCVLHTRSV